MKKILVIDDEREFCFLIKDMLEVSGKYRVIIATDGRSGIKATFDHRPDLILLDIMMPGLDGFEVLKRLKENIRTQSIPVIMLTARDDEESKTEAAQLYNEAYLVKPVEMAVLRAKIEKVLSTASL